MSCKPLLSGALLSMERSNLVDIKHCYHLSNYEPAEYTDFWSNVLSYAKIDILALQEFYNPAEGDRHRAAYEDYKEYYQRFL